MKKAHGIPLTSLAMAGVFVMFSAASWASTGACLNPSGQTVSGCSAVDGAFTSFLTPANNDFNSTGVGTNYLYNPTLADQGGTGWTFNSTGTANGVSNANGALIYGSTWYDSAPPSGTQVAGLQQFSGSTSEASISQTITGFTLGADYAVTFDMALRNGLCACSTGVSPATPDVGDPIEVVLGSQILGTFTPTTGVWTPVTTGMMVATSTTMNLQFISTATGTLSASEVDTLFTDVFIDDPTPEPATLALTGTSLLLLGGLWRIRKRRKPMLSNAA